MAQDYWQEAGVKVLKILQIDNANEPTLILSKSPLLHNSIAHKAKSIIVIELYSTSQKWALQSFISMLTILLIYTKSIDNY